MIFRKLCKGKRKTENGRRRLKIQLILRRERESKYLCSYVFVSDIDPINFMSTYTGTLFLIMCKYYRAPYRFVDEDDSSDDDCTQKKPTTIRKSPRKGVPRQRIPPPLPPLPELTTTTARPQTATPPEQPRETMQSSVGAPNLPTLFDMSRKSQPSCK